ncbi:hypothetical protein EDD21DRAFT_411690 [Dissophora ornata]|nr:hypothetical protein EDD21DRAFT_411690 [Dissophora ornata]
MLDLRKRQPKESAALSRATPKGLKEEDFTLRNLKSDIDDLKKLIKAENTVFFSDVDANMLTIWPVSAPLMDGEEDLSIIPHTQMKKLGLVTDLSEVLSEGAPRKTNNIFVKRPSPESSETQEPPNTVDKALK